jgi:predicted acetyltransferase
VPIEIRSIREDELEAWSAALARTEFATADPSTLADFRRSRLIAGDLERMLAAYDGPRIVGTFRSFAEELTLPGGGLVPVAAVTNVTTLATHRRRGVLTQFMAPDLRADAERGETAALLIASEYPIYGRFRFGPATEHVRWSFDRARSRFADPLDPLVAQVETVRPEDARSILPGIYEAHRRAQPGEIDRREAWWDVDLGFQESPAHPSSKGWLVLHRDAVGTPDGYLRYRVQDDFDQRVPNAKLFIDELIATNPLTEAALWRHAFDTDLVTAIIAADRRLHEPVVWRLADARAARMTQRADFLWVRPLDVPGLLEARTYPVEGHVVIEVLDPAGIASGRFALDAGREGATCRPSTEEAGLRLPVDVLGSVVLGGVSLRMLADAGRLDVLDPVALPAANALFRWPVDPWCTTWF